MKCIRRHLRHRRRRYLHCYIRYIHRRHSLSMRAKGPEQRRTIQGVEPLLPS